ncbi:hypothetical protein GCM10010387_50670 [Streptomyces inusitatus]|uniref:Thymidylate kinase n=2 Tax=Streptomyces inusitatus TaxID=68221 RepID=A0A918V0Q9_9ACTN|nr:hypothetical protein GCM10010387_50670 [Streptomyces inusitatus]
MRAALVGVDGSGKTTAVHRVRERKGVTTLHTIPTGTDPRTPFPALSPALAEASAAADALGGIQLKVAVLYLQLSLYGPAESRAATPSGILLADRHPLIDPLVYLPLFAHIERDDDGSAQVSAWWRKQRPEAARLVRDWLRTCTGDDDPWSLGTEMLRLGTREPQEILDRLTERLGVTAPDAVLWLDLPVAQALHRTRERPRHGEMHETTAFLSAARLHYAEVLEWLSETRPQLTVRRIDCADRSVDEVTEEVWSALETFTGPVGRGEGLPLIHNS